MVSKYFQRTVLSHIAFVGIGYILLRAVWLFLFLRYGEYDVGVNPPPPPPPLVSLLTLTAAIFYSYRLRKYRPVPHNPIQQFQINLIIATYAVIVALSVAIPCCASLSYGDDISFWPIVAAIYVFFAWRHVYSVDPVSIRDIHSRSMSGWDQVIFDSIKCDSPYRRR